jgi:hypothetical protein
MLQCTQGSGAQVVLAFVSSNVLSISHFLCVLFFFGSILKKTLATYIYIYFYADYKHAYITIVCSQIDFVWAIKLVRNETASIYRPNNNKLKRKGICI